ncbi:hypothetical protein CEXT_393881 [Caerostris extrusa]|uniref:Uncharacterized protein n=1 Tax=Caerostris extrusa TaxID=172846 RepID=A0AAV4RK55_CAEEX|nr:hypothetical protein CEXT_393881 [Caerostris extrusa]
MEHPKSKTTERKITNSANAQETKPAKKKLQHRNGSEALSKPLVPWHYVTNTRIESLQKIHSIKPKPGFLYI